MGSGRPHPPADRLHGVPGIAWELDLGFSAAEVAAGVAELLAARGLDARIEADGPRRIFRTANAVVAVQPLPPERATPTLFHPRTLLVLDGSGPAVETLKASIRLKFLRVMA